MEKLIIARVIEYLEEYQKTLEMDYDMTLEGFMYFLKDKLQ